MNENEIRDRVREALGDATYPPALKARVEGRIREPRTSPYPRAMGYVAAILALLIVGTLIFVRQQTVSGPPLIIPASSPGPVNPNAQLPDADLARANLAGTAADFVTPFNIASQSSGRTVTLIGAYADTARTVLFFRSMPAGGFASVQVADQQGLLNAGGGGGVGIVGDQVSEIEMGPHVGPDGLAHLTVSMFDIQNGPAPGGHQPGNWTFSLALKVQSSVPVSLTPALNSLGPWKVTVEAAEVTPTVIHFKVLLDGRKPSPDDGAGLTLMDAAGKPLMASSGSTSLAAPKQLGSSGATRFESVWPRPAHAATYQLVMSVGGHEYRGSFAVPEPLPAKLRKGQPIAPETYPVFAEAIDLQGAFTVGVVSGFTNQCGYGSGPDGAIFVFGTWFQADGTWYWIGFSTLPSIRQYKGPGTYTARAGIDPYAPFGADPIFAGTVQLTVSSDKGVDKGSVNGSLTWTGNSAQIFQDVVRGDWTCTPSPALGPG
jgi:hypothetical protein